MSGMAAGTREQKHAFPLVPTYDLIDFERQAEWFRSKLLLVLGKPMSKNNVLVRTSRIDELG